MTAWFDVVGDDMDASWLLGSSRYGGVGVWIEDGFSCIRLDPLRMSS